MRLGAIILGGGRGERLAPLTSYRAKPAVHIGGKYRLIDVPISNCINSGINLIHVLTQFNTTSLHRHISRTYKFDIYSGGDIEILAAQQTAKNKDWFQGTADAVRSYWDRFEQMNATHYIILAGDHLYKMDYSEFFEHHLATGADVSVGVRPMPTATASELGVLKANSDDEITRFVEKPQSADLIDELADDMDGEKKVLASMGIYIFNKEVLNEVLKIEGDDFGKNIIPHSIETLKTTAFRFQGYWEDIGTIRTFFESSIALTKENPHFTFYNEENPVYTRQRFLPGSEIRGAKIDHSIISEGCKVGNAQLKDSIIGIRSIIGDGVKLDRTYFMGADFYDNDESNPIIPMGVGANSILSNVIADKNVRIGKNVKLTNKDDLKEFRSDTVTIKDGIIIIPKNATIPDNFEI
ncbi:MAG: glucose-1-phosphate adenylyltransferase [Candidatus Marinimicrobia bacterium]|nr:glucose-1-phosphate adenylyltransferase [Candidatus Neomarinimicrobiota bacterium]MBT3576240.1 glucose-1-phosphate adenylyltransferase [Candidatus Neomarinimicrobiota bacterium]MBT3680783.1 glucose-1-phosphate adenylyltransferase [Candidatus Neomarinimicrobiota bacterium]MBT3950768.1 glucose-1-phosphate adenylyltransferase [Candidatus Neomarinimicrobiota bacterium]MBT4252346.1 glucose-1-phosphate adenylyltransferase [Candidatus Neomarinimicrobiota bacterium]